MKDYYELIPNKTKEEVKGIWLDLYVECDYDIYKSLEGFCNFFNLYFDKNLINASSTSYEKIYSEYLKRISSLPQYRGKTFSDKPTKKEFDLIDTLKIEQKMLIDKIAKLREKGDFGSYKNLIVALRDISRLIHDEENMKRWEFKK